MRKESESGTSKYREILKSWEPPFTKTRDEAWEALQARIASAKIEAKIIRVNWQRWTTVAAAAAVLAFGIYFFWPENDANTTIASLSERLKQHTLPDGSVVVMNAQSEISYSSEWKERNLTLSGEAFFDVAKGSTFTVTSVNGRVEVTGTEFNVLDRDEFLQVACFEGSVKVISKENHTLLVQGEMVKAATGIWTENNFDPMRKFWRDGEFYYDEEPLENVLEEMERQFNIVIEAPNIAGKIYTGNFSNDDMKEALSLVCLPMGLEFEIRTDMQVVLSEMHD